MNNSNYFKDTFESITDYRKVVLLIFLIQNDKNLSKETEFSENDNNLSNLEFEKILIEGQKEYLVYVKNIEESTIEVFSNK